MEYLFIPQFLQSNVVDVILNIAKKRNEKVSEVGGVVNLNKKIRKDTFFSNQENESFDNHIFHVLQPLVKEHFHVELSYREGYKVGTYYGEDGGFYVPHTDTQGGMNYRNISCVICLSRKEDYEGGVFQFTDLEKEFKFDKGDAVIFDSNLLHGVEPVTSGKRQIIATFMWNEENKSLCKNFYPCYIPKKKCFGDIDYSNDACKRTWKDEDNYMFEDNNSNTLLITFAGMGVKGSVPTFIFHNFLKCYSIIDKLFLRDMKCQYYVSGLKNQTSSLQETIDFIKRKISSKKYDKIIALGCSAGGFAAILFGQLLNFTKIIAFAPQTVLNERKETLIGDTYNAYSTCISLRKRLPNDEFYHSCLDLKNLQPFNVPVVIHYSASGNKGVDKKHALYLDDEKCETFEHPGSDHMIALTLRNHGKLKKIIDSAIE